MFKEPGEGRPLSAGQASGPSTRGHLLQSLGHTTDTVWPWAALSLSGPMSWALQPQEGLRMLYPPGSQRHLTSSGSGARPGCPRFPPLPDPLTPLHNPEAESSAVTAVTPRGRGLLSSRPSAPSRLHSAHGRPCSRSPGTGGLQDHGQHPASACPQPVLSLSSACLPPGPSALSQATGPDASAAAAEGSGAPVKGSPRWRTYK